MSDIEFPQYYLTKLTQFHCKRGSQSCEKCNILSKEGEKYCILRLYPKDDNVARPVIELDLGSTPHIVPFEFFKCFDSIEEARSCTEDCLEDPELSKV